MCADQAKKFFNDRPVPKPATVIVPASYVDHYDAQANLCYIAILKSESVTGGQTITFSTAVFDAF
jgi:hypothetical protein